jgi:Caspase domain
MNNLSWNVNKSQAVLIGASEFVDEDLTNLPSVENNILTLKDVLENTEIIGIPPSNISVLLNHDYSSQTTTELALRAREAFDTLFIYYAGHGKSNNSKELLLTVKGTNTKALKSSAINFKEIQEIALDSPATKKIIIIDSCFSGRATNYMGNEAELIKMNCVEGTYLITSVPPNDLAKAFDEERIYTAFTSKLIKVLKDGTDNGRTWLTINDIYEFVRDESTYFSNPQRIANQNINEFRFARNRQQAFTDFDFVESSLLSNQNTTISRISFQTLKKFESINNLHSQRFIVIKNSSLENLNLMPGDWVEIDVIRNNSKIHYEYCTIFSVPDENLEVSIAIPLMMRNLLRITDFIDTLGQLNNDSQIKIKKFCPNPISYWEITSNDWICRLSIPRELQHQYLNERIVAIRNLEFDQLQLDILSEITLEFYNEFEEYFVFDAKAIRFVDNPGRAVIGLDRNLFGEAFRMKEPFTIKIFSSPN